MGISGKLSINRELKWNKSKILVTKTNEKGIIEYANKNFIQVCGYSEKELIGTPHSIVRHPDMPRTIFKILWEKLAVGEDVHVVIKNKAKSGEYYWVITNFKPVYDSESNKIVNYVGSRKAISQNVIDRVEPLYRKLLCIEERSGVKICEKYMNGFLEDKGITYSDLVKSFMEEKMRLIKRVD